MTCVIAFFCAVEPSPFSVPEAAAPAAAEEPDAAPLLLLLVVVPDVLSEPQAASARAALMATPATRPDRESFTAEIPLSRVLRRAAPANSRRAPAGRRRRR